jgi:hypothetical protein
VYLIIKVGRGGRGGWWGCRECFLDFLFLILSLSSFISCLPFPACITFDLLSRRSAHTATPNSRLLAWLCLVRELTCQNRLHIRHGNLDRRRNLPNDIRPCRRSTLSRLGRSRMGRSIRVVLSYVPFPSSPSFLQPGVYSTIAIHHHDSGMGERI